MRLISRHKRPLSLGKYPMEKLRCVERPTTKIADGRIGDDIASEAVPLSEDPQEVADHIKAMCHFLDADAVGICQNPDYAWYSHDAAGEPILPGHKYAIVLLIDQGYETMAGSSGDDWIQWRPKFSRLS
jgi:hypothetical protein